MCCSAGVSISVHAMALKALSPGRARGGTAPPHAGSMISSSLNLHAVVPMGTVP